MKKAGTGLNRAFSKKRAGTGACPYREKYWV